MHTTQTLLEELNTKMVALHRTFEDLSWTSQMGDHSVDDALVAAETALNDFRADADLYQQVEILLQDETGKDRKYLEQWQRFFACYQAPEHVRALRQQIAQIETDIQKERSTRKEGYTDPYTGEFVSASRNKMRLMKETHDDEAVRKACYEATEALALTQAKDLVRLVPLRNEYARSLGYEDFYAYVLDIGEGMTKEELFFIFDDLYEKTKFGFERLTELEKTKPGLRSPWNTSYMLSGDLKQQEDPYLDFGQMVLWWGQSFAALGIGFKGATLQLDLVERDEKYDNGFCHWPGLVHFKDGERIPGASNFTCTAIPGQIGSGARAALTLFHEGGHAAHFTNFETTQVCMNHEYPPTSITWAEVQSMFLDALQESPEWLDRYAKDSEGNSYPFKLQEAQIRRGHPALPLRTMSICAVVAFERWLYEADTPTEAEVIAMAREVTAKHTNYTADSHYVLHVPHIYSWDSSCYYQSYGLAELAVEQWRSYFYEKYGFMVDNPKVGEEMRAVWEQGNLKTLSQFVEMATGKPLSADAYVKSVKGTPEELIAEAKAHIERQRQVPRFDGEIDLDGVIKMVHGKEVIADNSLGFEAMAASYAGWLKTLETAKAAA